MKIQINKPCHEDWSKMTAEAQGKFCNVCEKSVVDFSGMSDAEILYYFSKPKSEKVCGRFNVEQLERPLSNPIPKVASPSTQLLQFAYVLVVVLGVGLSSCGETVKGKVLISKHQDSSVSKIGEVEMGKVSSSVNETTTAHASSSMTEMGETAIIMGNTLIKKAPPKEDSTGCRPNPVLPLETNPSVPQTVIPSKKVFIKGKVRVNKPQYIQGDTIVEDRKIMGECVIPDVIRE